ncbi:MAG: hypothetical protein WAN36_09125 [Calditrichia bacterium]
MRGNPLREFIPDDLFYKLKAKGFLNDRAIRDYYMKQRFEVLKKNHPPKEIFVMLQREFPYLSVDTVRKIIYSRNGFEYISSFQ